MRRSFVTGAVLAAAAAVIATAAVTISGQEAGSRSAAGSAPLRTTDGHPDLQGVWDFRTLTPLQRPAEYADKER